MSRVSGAAKEWQAMKLQHWSAGGQCVKGCIGYLGTVSFLPEGDATY